MATVDQTMMKVQRMLTGPMGLRISLRGDAIWVEFDGMSTAAQVRVRDWGVDTDGDPQSLVVISAPLLRDVPPTPQLYEWIARNGGSRWFGSINLYEQEGGMVHLTLAHTLLGDYLDEEELRSALFGILNGADTWDDELQSLFGGKRWADE